MTEFSINPSPGALGGRVRTPGDKSISHRAVMFSAIAEGVTEISGLLDGSDVIATISALQQMGVIVERPARDRAIVHGVGMHGLAAPDGPLDLGNSGTAMRLLTGLMCGQSFDSVLIGDESLSTRPMLRIIDPLSEMGAVVASTAEGTAPLRVSGGKPMNGITYAMPVASAQVKSCLLIAGLYAAGRTEVREPATTRDHTERMLRGFGYEVECSDATAMVRGGGRLQSVGSIEVPGDISSATFFIIAGLCSAGDGSIVLDHVGINPTRDGVLRILEQMGGDVRREDEHVVGGEPVCRLVVRRSELRGIAIDREHVPLAIDELPAVMTAAALAEGTTVLRGAKELRVKESDRIATTVAGLRALGVWVEEFDDGMAVTGGRVGPGVVDSHGDHRIAMAFAMLGAHAEGSVRVLNCANVATSFPDFAELASGIGVQLIVRD